MIYFSTICFDISDEYEMSNLVGREKLLITDQKPKIHERKKHSKNVVSNQPSNSAASLITNISYMEFPQLPNMSEASSVMRKTAVAGSNMKRQL